MKRFICGLIMAAATAPAFSKPIINIGSMVEIIEPDKTTLVKRIRNSGADTAFIRVMISEIHYDQQGKSRETELDALSLAKGIGTGLVASPARMIVPARGMQINRLLYVGGRKKERYYRVRYVPVMPNDQKEFGQTKQEFDDLKKSLKAGVNVLTGYGAIFIIRPKTVSYASMTQETNTSFKVTNNGNTTITLENIYECAAGLKQCEKPQHRNVLPGRSLELPKKSGRSYKFDLIEGTKKQSVTFGLTN